MFILFRIFTLFLSFRIMVLMSCAQDICPERVAGDMKFWKSWTSTVGSLSGVGTIDIMVCKLLEAHHRLKIFCSVKFAQFIFELTWFCISPSKLKKNNNNKKGIFIIHQFFSFKRSITTLQNSFTVSVQLVVCTIWQNWAYCRIINSIPSSSTHLDEVSCSKI